MIIKINFKCSLMFLCLSLILPLAVFAQGEKKAVYGLLIDNTGSMRMQIHNIKSISQDIADKKSRQGIVSVFNFETRNNGKDMFSIVTRGTEWSQDNLIIDKYIENLNTVIGRTLLFDAILAAAKVTATKASSENITEKAIIIITDGEDRKSKVKEKELIVELKSLGVKVYAVGLVEELDSPAEIGQTDQREKSTKFLKKITAETGGNVVFPKLKTTTKIEDLITELFTPTVKT